MSSPMPRARNATLRISRPAARTAGGLAGGGGTWGVGSGLVARRRDEHEDAVEAREVHCGSGVDVLVAAELALDDLRHPGDRDSAREPSTLAARHEQVADLDVVARVDHLDLAAVAGRVARAADDPPGARPL